VSGNSRLLPRALALAALSGAFCLLYRHIFVDLVRDWVDNPNYSHGFLILPIAAYFVWLRRAELKSVPARPSSIGLLIVLVGLLMLMVGTIGVEQFLMRSSMIVVAAGTIVFLGGFSYLRVLALPIAFSFLMIPLPAIVFNEIAFPLQTLAARLGVGLLRFADVPVLREGNVIVLAHTSLEVAEACSGIRSLVSLLALAIVFGNLSALPATLQLLTALCSVPIAIVANALRIAGTGIAAHHFGAAAAEGFFHAFSGWLVFMVSFALLVVIVRFLTRVSQDFFPATEERLPA